MRLLVCGDRHWDDVELVRSVITLWYECANGDLTIIEGGADGADMIAKRVGEELGVPVVEYTAEWARYGKASGPMRNLRMIEEGKPDYVIAFHDHIVRSKGTKDMLRQAREAGLHFELCAHMDDDDAKRVGELPIEQDGPATLFELALRHPTRDYVHNGQKRRTRVHRTRSGSRLVDILVGEQLVARHKVSSVNDISAALQRTIKASDPKWTLE